MADQFSSSAALRFTEQELGGPCTEVESNPTCGVSVTTLAQGNGDRVGLVIINLGATTMYVGLNSGVSPTNGIAVTAGGGFLALTVRDDFTLPSRQWSAVSPVNPTQVYVLEIVRFTASGIGG